MSSSRFANPFMAKSPLHDNHDEPPVVREELDDKGKEIYDNLRKEKKKPGLDYKIITSWNGLMISGYVNAYKAINDEVFMNEAINAGEFIYSNLVKKDGGLFHNYVNGQSKINGYLEDYAMVIQASLDLYEITLNQLWIERALKLSEYVINNFSSSESELFYFTSKKDEDLISRSVEFRDNVIPSSNSIMAKNLFRLYHYFDKEEYYERSKNMSLSVTQEFEACLLYTSPSPRDATLSRMPSSA